MKRISAWFIGLSGFYDIFLGLAVALSAPSGGAAERVVWTSLVTLGGMLVFCGCVLVWAVRDLDARGPVVAWQGLVRLLATAAIFHALGHDYLLPAQAAVSRVAAIVDLATAILYFAALIFIWRWPVINLLLGRQRSGEP